MPSMPCGADHAEGGWQHLPTCFSPQCANCGADHPANFSSCPKGVEGLAEQRARARLSSQLSYNAVLPVTPGGPFPRTWTWYGATATEMLAELVRTLTAYPSGFTPLEDCGTPHSLFACMRQVFRRHICSVPRRIALYDTHISQTPLKCLVSADGTPRSRQGTRIPTRRR